MSQERTTVDIVKKVLTEIITNTSFLFELFCQAPSNNLCGKHYNAALPLPLRKILLNQMNATLDRLDNDSFLPVASAFLIDDKLCFDKYPAVLSELCLSSFSELPQDILTDCSNAASEILMDFSLLVEILDNDIQKFYTTLHSCLLCASFTRKSTNRLSKFESEMHSNQSLFNSVSFVDVLLREMRKYTKEFFCVANSLKTKCFDKKKGLLRRHGSLLLYLHDIYDEKMMVHVVLVLYERGLQLYVLPVPNVITTELWISRENLRFGNIIGEDGEEWKSGWYILPIKDMSTTKEYLLCSDDSSLILLWRDELLLNSLFYERQYFGKGTPELFNEVPFVIHNVIKELLFRGSETLKNFEKVKGKQSVKRAVQLNSHVDMATFPIEDVVLYFITYLKNMKPKLFKKEDIEEILKINPHSNTLQESGLFQFLSTYEYKNSLILKSLLFLLESLLLNYKSFSMSDAIKVLSYGMDSYFKKKMNEMHELLTYTIVNISASLPFTSSIFTPIIISNVTLLDESPMRLYTTSNQNIIAMTPETMHIIGLNKVTVQLPHKYVCSCSSKSAVYIASNSKVSKWVNNTFETVEQKGIRAMCVVNEVLMFVKPKSVEFVDAQKYTLIQSHQIDVELVKVSSTSTDFIVCVNNTTILVFDEHGNKSTIRTFYSEKDVSALECANEKILLGHSDGSISIMSTSLKENGIITALEGAILSIVSGDGTIFALSSNNTVIITDFISMKVVAIFKPISQTNGMMYYNNHLYIATINGIIQYVSNRPKPSAQQNITPFYQDVPLCISKPVHSYIPNIFGVKGCCSCCNKPVINNGVLCRFCLALFHHSCVTESNQDCSYV
ncbi:hypothetical protein EIN_417040 [Entamoeba invadens IP1]|uniref:Phorbol-ester/DAG-type domain-containing protein n=1 Tax=Entamoeba invadens IP1 TaxID=370355 RepID=A0A0A1TUD3_ENTIV|nr:hypothetical protein EIN_417040 [Entamoeba invadens IP1]ELP83625.1 hypothetical protein EIN_417040 [Entamoeba invadens IP1]|eukprot:XP_004182971.1 hypothetical protein EIN_417040 [Entamoeba invadens IP1]